MDDTISSAELFRFVFENLRNRSKWSPISGRRRLPGRIDGIGPLQYVRNSQFEIGNPGDFHHVVLMGRPCSIVDFSNIPLKEGVNAKFSFTVEEFHVDESARQRLRAADDGLRKTIRIYESGEQFEPGGQPRSIRDDITYSELASFLNGNKSKRPGEGPLKFVIVGANSEHSLAQYFVEPSTLLKIRGNMPDEDFRMTWFFANTTFPRIIVWHGPDDDYKLFSADLWSVIGPNEGGDEEEPGSKGADNEIQQHKSSRLHERNRIRRTLREYSSAVKRNDAERIAEFTDGSDDNQVKPLLESARQHNSKGLLDANPKGVITRGALGIAVMPFPQRPLQRGQDAKRDEREGAGTAVVFRLILKDNRWKIRTIDEMNIEEVIVTVCRLFASNAQ